MQHTYPKTGTLMWVGSLNISQINLRHVAMQYAKERLTDSTTSPSNANGAHLFEAGHHPDFKLVEPEKENGTIKIEQIRDLIAWATTKPSIAPIKLALIHPAEAMNGQSANALLKTLEEPNENTQFLLISYQPSLLPLTLRSRCHIIRNRTNVNSLPSLQDKDPLKILISDDLEAIRKGEKEPLEVVSSWIKKDLHQVLYWLMVVLCEFTNTCIETEQVLKSKRWWRFMDELFLAKRSLEMKSQANTELVLESLLIQYARLITTKGNIDVRSEDSDTPFQTNFSLNHQG